MVYFDTIDWCHQTGQSVIESAASLGFSGVVLNEPLTPPTQKSKGDCKMLKCNIVKRKVYLKNGSQLNLSGGRFPILDVIPLSVREKIQADEIIQLTRATVIISQPSQVSFLNQLAKQHLYDIIGVTPQNDAAWVSLIAQGDFDIVSLDLTSCRLPFLLRRNQLMQLARKNVFFEIRFNEALMDTQCRRHLLTNVQQLIRFVPHQQIIVSSGASTPINLRSPTDVIAFAKLLGITNSPRKVITDNVLNSIYKAGCRQTSGGAVGCLSTIESRTNLD